MIDLSFRDLEAIRTAIASLTDPIAALLSHRKRLLLAPAHTDDIVAAYRAGIEEAASDYEERLASFSTNPRLDDVASVMGVGAALYFMRELIAAKGPSVLERLCPDAKSGMRASDRQRAVREVEDQLRRLYDEREELSMKLRNQQFTLRDLRQEALFQNDRKARGAIESVQMDLPAEIDAVRRDQDALLLRLADKTGRA